MIPPSDKNLPYQPLIRETNKLSYFPFMPYIENDNTDLISFNYRQITRNKADKSFPSTQNIKLSNYIQEMQAGLFKGYEKISYSRDVILKLLRQNNFLSRQIVRPTLYYVWIIHRYLHPANKKHERFLFENIKNLNNKITEYEKLFIPFGNIPVFYNKLHSKHLYDYKGKIIEKNYFEKTSYYWICKKINSLNNTNFIKDRGYQLSKSLK